MGPSCPQVSHLPRGLTWLLNLEAENSSVRLKKVIMNSGNFCKHLELPNSRSRCHRLQLCGLPHTTGLLFLSAWLQPRKPEAGSNAQHPAGQLLTQLAWICSVSTLVVPNSPNNLLLQGQPHNEDYCQLGGCGAIRSA